MTLDQFHHLKQWHSRHWRDHPMERQVWDVVLTLWIVGWVGGAASVVLAMPWAAVTCFALLFLPSVYTGLRARLHSARRLRCDWIVVLR